MAEGDYVYIRNEGDGGEELFDERDDTRELMNRAHAPAMLPVLRRFRDRIGRIEGDPSGARDKPGGAREAPSP